MIERLQVRVPAGAAGEFSSPELSFCADSKSLFVPSRVTAVACKRPRSFFQKYSWQVAPKHAYTRGPTKSEWADYTVQAQGGNLSGKRPHTQLVKDTWQQSSQLAEPLWSDRPRNLSITTPALYQQATPTPRARISRCMNQTGAYFSRWVSE